MTKPQAHPWAFKARFRRSGFGWKSQPAVARVKEAVAEIRKVAKKDPVVAAEGAVTFLERVSPALEHVDGSSGSIGNAVNNAVAELSRLIASAPADEKTRSVWLERLFEAIQEDRMPYIEGLGDLWGDLCASDSLASVWADRLIGTTRLALSPDPNLRGHFSGTSVCLSALFRARRYDELIDLLNTDALWHYTFWKAKALAAQGKKQEAIRFAESCRSPWSSDSGIDALCEEVLLSSGLVDEAYRRYGLRSLRGGTYLASFRAVAEKYPHKKPSEILADLANRSPGAEGKWFAAAKDAGLFEEALALARRAPCDPKTLTRASRDHAEKRAGFALEAGLLALHWLLQGHGYEITSGDVWDAYRATLTAAERLGTSAAVKERVRSMVAAEGPGDRFVTKSLARELGL